VVLDKDAGSWFIADSSVVGYDGVQNVRDEEPSDTHDEHARAALWRGEEENEGGGGVPQRGECEHAGHRDSIEEQRAVGAEALTHDGGPRSNGKAKPTAFET
jgi:hypothetical protein